jgi:hypothetical protein
VTKPAKPPARHKAKRGRPPTDPSGQTRSNRERLVVRLTPAEKAALDRYCMRTGTTSAELVRSRLADVLGG